MCYFNSHPAAHHEQGKTEHYCKFNNAYKVNDGHYGPTNLAGAKFWLTGDLGGDFSQGQMDWALVTLIRPQCKNNAKLWVTSLDTSSRSSGNRSRLQKVASTPGHLTRTKAHATLNGGKTAEVKLQRFQGMTDEPAVLKNVKYWGTPRNDGFVMMPNES